MKNELVSIDKFAVPVLNFDKSNIFNYELFSKVLKENIFSLEKFKCIFKDVFLILNDFNITFINFTGFKIKWISSFERKHYLHFKFT